VVVKEEHVAGVWKDRGDVGGDEVLVLARPQDRGGPLRTATIFIGSLAETTQNA